MQIGTETTILKFEHFWELIIKFRINEQIQYRCAFSFIFHCQLRKNNNQPDLLLYR